MYRSLSHGATDHRTTLIASSSGTVVFSGLRNSIAWQAAKSSIAMTFSTFLTTWRHFLAAKPPMETWSSVPALVERESTLAGWHSVLFSDTKAAAVQWAIMNPELSPPSLTRK